VLLTAALLAAGPAPRGSAQTVLDGIAVGRSTVAAERTAFVAEAMQFSEQDSKVFWPLYREYRATMEKTGDDLLKLVLEYSDLYPDVPEERANQMLKDYIALETRHVEAKAAFLKKVAKSMTAAQTLRLAQVENRLDSAVRQQLASVIPLVPGETKPQQDGTPAEAAP
jgi:hypothetical protein